jgi:hypothetical protein
MAYADVMGGLPDACAVLATRRHNLFYYWVVVARLEDTEPTTVLEAVGNPTFSPDGRWVAYDHYVHRPGDVYSSPEDIRVRDLTDATSQERVVMRGWSHTFSWSPDGDAVAAVDVKESSVDDDVFTVARVDGRGTWTKRGGPQSFSFAPVAR